jgi:hypothetical protein
MFTSSALEYSFHLFDIFIITAVLLPARQKNPIQYDAISIPREQVG